MEDKKISIIIPLYNAEKYITKCIDSILAQEDENYEIVIVNDGSSDKSRDIVRSYCDKYSSILLVDKENGGVSSARNLGLDLAKGDFVVFVDSDDWLKKDCLSFFRKTYCETEADIISTKLLIHRDLSKMELTPNYEEMEAERFVDFRKKLFNGSVCGKLFKRDVIDSVRFKEGIFYEEDSLFVCQTALQAKKIVTADCAFYQYNLNDQSATHKYTIDKLYTRYKARCLITEAIKEKFPELYSVAFAEQLICAEKVILLALENCNCKELKIVELQSVVRRNLKTILSSHADMQIKIAGVLIAMSPMLAYRTMTMLERVRNRSYRKNIALMVGND